MIRCVFPHLDDCVLSMGQYLITEPGVVYTVFGGIPKQFGMLTPYDRQTGFQTSATAMLARRDEDKAALKVLGSVSRPMSFLDQQYRDGEQVDFEAVVDAIRGLVDPEIHLFAPLGIGHPDHRLVARCVRLACPPEILFVEDLPYKCLWPEQVSAALDEIRAEGWTVDEDPFPMTAGPLAIKEHAIAKYASQYPNGADHACLVQERAWRATR